MNYQVFVGPDGLLRFVYADELAAAMRPIGSQEIRRASHVEPARGGWVADLSPSNGPELGPFETRHEALTREENWLNERGCCAGVL